MQQIPVVSRFGPVVLVGLAHLALVLALLHLTGTPGSRFPDTPQSTIAFAFIPALKPPPPKTREKPPSIDVPVMRRDRHAPEPERAPGVVAVLPAAMPDAPAPAGAATAAASGIDMEALRAAARQMDSERAPDGGREPQRLRAMDDTVLSRAVQKAKRPDCQTKYAGGEAANILLLIPLAIETITDKGCKW